MNYTPFNFSWPEQELNLDGKIKTVQLRVKSALNFYGLHDWKIKIDYRSKLRAGQCRYEAKEIGISMWLIRDNKFEQFESTIKHEIAHAIAGIFHNDYAHGSIWKRVARQIGDDGERCYKPGEYKNNNKFNEFIYRCDTCNTEHKLRRKLKRQASCTICSPVFDPRFLVVLKKINGQDVV